MADNQLLFRTVTTFPKNVTNGYIPEMEQIIGQLERGTLIMKFYNKKRPERKTLLIQRETNQLVWIKPGVGSTSLIRNPYEGCVDFRDVHEIRNGKLSKEFEKWPDESKKIEKLKCFVLFYGNQFKLRTLSIAGKFFLHTKISHMLAESKFV